ncbi:MAG: 4-(cytidine 5'-diphospho)-2-C-methyl-D-erythritol kinase [Agriterribacter sp.]
MVLFPNCKINIGLHITSKREDGFHNIETVFYPVSWCDVLEIIEKAGNAGVDSLHTTGLKVPGNDADNICIKALQLLRNHFPSIPSVDIHLHKTIPSGAGLGGGSADGAFALRLLNEKFSLGLSTEQLVKYAIQLGSDCPFFIENKPCYATGRGEVMERVALDLSGYGIMLVNPGVHINTGWAFSKITPAASSIPLTQLIHQPIQTWKTAIRNDFEKAVFQQYPEIGNIKETMYAHGALYSSMTGSGSTVYGFFPSGNVPSITWSNNYAVKIIV